MKLKMKNSVACFHDGKDYALQRGESYSVPDEVPVKLANELVRAGHGDADGKGGSKETKPLDQYSIRDLHAKAVELGKEVRGVNSYKGEEGKKELLEIIAEPEETGLEDTGEEE